MIKLTEIISASPDQFEFEYSETGNQFEFGLRDISEQEFAAESIGILNGRDLHIESIGTSPKYRRMGLGAKLLNYIIDFAKERQIVKIDLEVRSSNKTAISLYKKYGFHPIDKKRGNTLDKMELVLEIKAVPNINLDDVLKLIKLIVQTLVDQDDFSNSEWMNLMNIYNIKGTIIGNLERLRGEGKLKNFYSEIQEFYKKIKNRGLIREIKNISNVPLKTIHSLWLKVFRNTSKLPISVGEYDNILSKYGWYEDNNPGLRMDFLKKLTNTQLNNFYKDLLDLKNKYK